MQKNSFEIHAAEQDFPNRHLLRPVLLVIVVRILHYKDIIPSARFPEFYELRGMEVLETFGSPYSFHFLKKKNWRELGC